MQNALVDRVPVRLRRPARLLRLASDERLVALVRNGEEGAFEALYDRHHPAILGFCRHMLGTREEAEDAVQHTFLSAFRDLGRSDKPIELRPWLFAIARNRCLSLLRTRRMHVELDRAEPATDGLSATVERREDLRELLADLASLPDDQRAALLLAELGALDHAGIATVLGCPREKVKALVFQARTSLAASREARATPCDEIRMALATAAGAELRRGALRRHLCVCAGCRAFKAEVATQRKLLALALPVVPSVALKASVLSAAMGGATASGGGAAAATGIATAGAAGSSSGTLGGMLGIAASSGAGKVAITLAVAGAVAGGGALSEQLRHDGRAPSAGAPTRHHEASPTLHLLRGSVQPQRTSGGATQGTAPTPVPSPRGAQTGGRAQQAPISTAGSPPNPPSTSTAGSPPAQGATPPGQASTPPGQARTPPGQTTAPPGQPATPPGQANTPPGQSNTPPGQARTPPGQANPPGQPNGTTPPGQAGASPGSSGSAPGQSGAAHGQGH